VLARQVAAPVGVGTCLKWPWETAATLPSVRRSRRFGAHGGGERRGISWRPPAYSLLLWLWWLLLLPYLQSHTTPTQMMMTQTSDDTPMIATRIITEIIMLKTFTNGINIFHTSGKQSVLL